MLIVRGVNVFPSALRELVNTFAPEVSGHILVRPRSAGVKQEPPLPVSIELAPGREASQRLSEAIGAKLRAELTVRAEIELVEFGQLQRSEYKSQLVAAPPRQTPVTSFGDE
jgi:phenylacetate-CoA ligase